MKECHSWRDFSPPNEQELRGWTPSDGNILRKNDYTSQRNRQLHDLIHRPILGAIAARLCGFGIRLRHDQLLYKPPSRRDQPISVGWHTDRQIDGEPDYRDPIYCPRLWPQ